jgi:hypothetical protein
MKSAAFAAEPSAASLLYVPASRRPAPFQLSMSRKNSFSLSEFGIPCPDYPDGTRDTGVVSWDVMQLDFCCNYRSPFAILPSLLPEPAKRKKSGRDDDSSQQTLNRSFFLRFCKHESPLSRLIGRRSVMRTRSSYLFPCLYVNHNFVTISYYTFWCKKCGDKQI